MTRFAALLGLFALISIPALPQDEPKKEEPKKQDEPQPEELELEIVVGKRPASADMQMQDPNFKLKEPMTLAGIAAKDKAVSSAVSRGMLYLLHEQLADGSWKFAPKAQIREEVPKNERYFSPTASQTLNQCVTTALCCMALRANEALAPERVQAAVEKALPFVIEKAPKHKSSQYEVWTWSLSIEFLVGEYARAKDEEMKAKIKEAVAATVEKLCTGQHKGEAKPPAVLPKQVEKQAKSGEIKKEKGFFGVQPVAEEGGELPGVLIQSVTKDSPAAKGGMKARDRILEINGVRVTGIEHLYESVAELPIGEPAKVKVLRGAKSQPGGRGGMRMNVQDGGWGYYNWMEAATNCTATALLALERARTIDVEVPEGTLARGYGYLAATKMIREGTDEIGFRYTMQDRGDALDVRSSVARTPPCFFALHTGGKATASEVERAIELFVRRRGELDKVLGYPGNHVGSSFFNSAYYFMWSHYYTSRSLKVIKDAEKRRRCGAVIQEALLKLQRDSGTWTDHEAWGQLYGTAMCLMALGELKFVTPGAYKAPLMTMERREY